MSQAKSHRSRRFGIMNHIGTIWTAETFDTEMEASDHLAMKRADWLSRGWGDLSRHRVVPVRVTVSPIATPSPRKEGDA